RQDRLNEPAPVIGPIELENFSRPSTIDQCLAALAGHPGAKLLAGGSDLAVDSNIHDRRAPHLVSVEAIDELREFSEDTARVRIGAALPLEDIGRRWTGAPGVVSE